MSVSFFLIVLIFFFVLLFGNTINKLTAFRQSMLKSMIPALVIGLIYVAGFVLGTLQAQYAARGLLGGCYIFCITSLGLAFTKGIKGFEPLPVSKSFVSKKGRLRQIVLFLLSAVLLPVLMLAVSSICFKGFLALFHEPNLNAQAVASLPARNKFLAFPLLLSGAGIAEESMFRLFFQSLFWRLIKRPWPAILLSSLCFALYHLSPADSMYQIYWQYPLAQASTVFISGIILGWFYRKRGFETTVLGHTLSDYIGVLLMPH